MLYVVDAGASRLTVRAFAGGVLGGMGHNPTFLARELTAEVTLDEDPASVSVRVAIKSASLALTDSVSDKDRREIEGVMNEEVLETATYPEIVFECPPGRVAITGATRGPFQAALDGTLTLRGVRRPQTLSVRVFPTGDTLRAQGEAALRQTDFGIGLVSVAGGMLKVKDEVRLAFDLVARPAPVQRPAAGADAPEAAGR